jgi:hypothetical protein
MTRQTKSNIYKKHRYNLRRPKTDQFYVWPEIARDERIMDNFLERLGEAERREEEFNRRLLKAARREERPDLYGPPRITFFPEESIVVID